MRVEDDGDLRINFAQLPATKKKGKRLRKLIVKEEDEEDCRDPPLVLL